MRKQPLLAVMGTTLAFSFAGAIGHNNPAGAEGHPSSGAGHARQVPARHPAHDAVHAAAVLGELRRAESPVRLPALAPAHDALVRLDGTPVPRRAGHHAGTAAAGLLRHSPAGWATMELAERLAVARVRAAGGGPARATRRTGGRPGRPHVRRAPAESALRARAYIPSGGVWLELRICESRDDYAADTGNGYFGAYQFALGTWQSIGFSGLPNEASAAVQDRAARVLEAERGWSPWPVCSLYLGLR